MDDQVPFEAPHPWITALLAIGWLFICFVPLGTLASLGYLCLSLPLRRRERASLLLDLMETGMEDGRPLEETIPSISATRENSLGVRFHLLAAYIEGGLPFHQALDHVPGLFPSPVVAMLKAGVKIGSLRKVLPACRQMMRDAVSNTRSAGNFLIVLAFLTTPATAYVFIILSVYVLPKFVYVASELGITDRPVGISFFLAHQGLFLSAQLVVLLAVWILAYFYVRGPKSNSMLRKALGTFPDRIHYLLPWRRKRMQRDFSAMLAVLLDAGMPESEALELAGDCTANDIFQQRVTRARDGLARGLKLAQAIEMIDDSGEFRWRLTQAVGRQGGFVAAIAGWKDALDTKAFQQEQATAQVATTALVLLNGVFVAIIAVTIFSVLISIINAGLLW